jgi:hypothetical protein
MVTPEIMNADRRSEDLENAIGAAKDWWRPAGMSVGRRVGLLPLDLPIGPRGRPRRSYVARLPELAG